ncbi:MAG TPA: AbrB/MazE/SpoVT family DNA-binding domain-containing protein [Candidatus Saccharimonadales bacterium]|nr:AbrB/MazE/SpoVT family DNA-binding domain-containing protein [Candidatus Saccharimonadales bacterium]
MTYAVTITSQGQLNIPVKIRQELGFFKKTKVLVSITEGKMVIEPIKDVLALRGSIQTNKQALSNDELHARFAHSLVEENIRKTRKKV